MEQNFEQSSLAVIEQAKQIVINNNEDYKNASEFLKEIKAQQKVITDHFADMKEQAHKAHKAICEKENGFLKPLKAVESQIKGLMSNYAEEQEKRRIEAILQATAQKEKLVEQFRADGNEEMAQMLEETMSIAPVSGVENISGVSTVDDYEIEIVDATKVPAYIDGVQIRTIDVNAIKELAKQTDGKIEIAGIKINKTKNIRVRNSKGMKENGGYIWETK